MVSKLNLESKVIVGSGDVVEESHASPTTTCRTDLMNSFAGDTAKPATLSSVVLVDSGGTERDSASIATGDWTLTSITNGYRATCTKTISITANYTIAKVRLYGGTSLYFEYTLASGINVTTGSQVTVSIQIDATWSISHTSGGTLVSADVSTYFGRTVLNRLCLGTEKGKKLNTVQLVYQGGTVTYFTGTISTDTPNIRLTLNASYTPANDTTIDEYDYSLDDLTVLVMIKIQAVTLGGGLTHTWTYTVNF